MINGFLLALQFFTIIPVKKELPLGRKEVTMMYCMLPIVGLIIGLSMYGIYYVSVFVFGFSILLTAVVLVVASFVATGGLHLDGWADTADAFFSYKDREKRLEILEDPRLGAFGTMALIFLVFIKTGLIYEVLHQQNDVIYAFVFIPFIVRALFNLCFATLPTGKKSGIAFFFKEKIHVNLLLIVSSLFIGIVLFLYVLFLGDLYVVLMLMAIFAVSVFYYRRWVTKHFHGITGDLSGAFIEGMEVLLWGTALFLL